jgi:hypothetical protein
MAVKLIHLPGELAGVLLPKLNAYFFLTSAAANGLRTTATITDYEKKSPNRPP